jgi:hypothetical protein
LLAENTPAVSDNNIEYGGVVNYLTDIGTLNINAIANGNYPGINNASYKGH